MNDFNENSKFSFGKVEMGVVPDDTGVKETIPISHSSRVNEALCNKMDAVDALDDMKHSLISNMSKAQYIVIRNSLEEMADIIREYEGKPIPVMGNRNQSNRGSSKKKRNKRR